MVWSSVYSPFGFSVIKSATPFAGTELNIFWCKMKGTKRENNNYPKMLRATHLNSLTLNNLTSSFPKWSKGRRWKKGQTSNTQMYVLFYFQLFFFHKVCLYIHGESHTDYVLLSICTYANPCGSTVLMPLCTHKIYQWLVSSKGGTACAKIHWRLVWNKKGRRPMLHWDSQHCGMYS